MWGYFNLLVAVSAARSTKHIWAVVAGGVAWCRRSLGQWRASPVRL